MKLLNAVLMHMKGILTADGAFRLMGFLRWIDPAVTGALSVYKNGIY